MTLAATRLPMILEVGARSVRRISPSYVRIELGGPALADFGVEGPLYDQRIKLIFPNAAGRLPSFEGADESWYAAWLDLPEEERGHLRTYTVREVKGSGVDTRVVVDFVLHMEEGETGPGATWAAQAVPGDRLVIIGPRRGEHFGGIEFAPGDARRLLMVADESAVPAVCSILEDLPAGAVGTAFLEVPEDADAQDVDHPVGVEVVWLPRAGSELGSRLDAEVQTYLGCRRQSRLEVEEVDPDLWETPTFSSSGDEIEGRRGAGGGALDELYAWIAGESSVVTGLRRLMVKEMGMARHQVAFMGYWRRGVAMR